MLLDTGSFGDAPWWVFLMMPLMMLGMGLMMWLMMRMMMGMGGHAASHEPADAPPKPASENASEEELASLRREVEALRSRLAALEVESTPHGRGDEPSASPHEGGAPASGKGEAP